MGAEKGWYRERLPSLQNGPDRISVGIPPASPAPGKGNRKKKYKKVENSNRSGQILSAKKIC